jgi:predicted transcriptional regulator
MQTKALTADIPAPLADKLDELAKRLERPQQWIVEQALAAWVELQEERHRLTLEALADVEEGRLLDHEAVQAWVDSLDTEDPLPPPQ